MKRRAYLIAVGAAMGSTIAGCSGGPDSGGSSVGGDPESTPEPSPQPTSDRSTVTQRTEQEEIEESSPEVTEEPTPEPAESIPAQTFSGSGAEVEQDIDIASGLVVVDAEHAGGSSNFQVKLVPSEGEYDELFVNEIGEYNGETAALVDEDVYTLDVEADGNWDVEIRQPRANSGDSLPLSLDGDTNIVEGPFEFTGSHIASGIHEGQSNFQVLVYPPEGRYGELVFNEIGQYEGETTFRQSGVGWVAVVGDGQWTVEME